MSLINDLVHLAAKLPSAADNAYYAVKHLEWVTRQLETITTQFVSVDDLVQLAITKYELRARPGNHKDVAAERQACMETFTYLKNEE